MAANSKKLDAKKIASLVDFIESKTNFPRLLILDAIFKFGHLYDLSALLRCFEWAQDNHEKDAAIFVTIMHDLNGIEQDPKTFSPRTAGY